MKSIHAPTEKQEYLSAIRDTAEQVDSWKDVDRSVLLPIYDILLRLEGQHEAWTALTYHDDANPEGGSALWWVRQALYQIGIGGQVSGMNLADRFRCNLSRYYDERIRDDLETAWAELREAELPWWKRRRLA